jgi:hypothetical protein
LAKKSCILSRVDRGEESLSLASLLLDPRRYRIGKTSSPELGNKTQSGRLKAARRVIQPHCVFRAPDVRQLHASGAHW